MNKCPICFDNIKYVIDCDRCICKICRDCYKKLVKKNCPICREKYDVLFVKHDIIVSLNMILIIFKLFMLIFSFWVLYNSFIILFLIYQFIIFLLTLIDIICYSIRIKSRLVKKFNLSFVKYGKKMITYLLQYIIDHNISLFVLLNTFTNNQLILYFNLNFPVENEN